MADIGYVQSLSGEEVIIDLLEQIAEKLRKDCNLREIDSYSSGYSASVKISIKLYGMDETPVEAEIEVGSENDDPELLQDAIEVTIDIPQETDLSLVRDRSKQETPTMEITSEGPVQGAKRRYTRRVKALASATGGAAEPMAD